MVVKVPYESRKFVKVSGINITQKDALDTFLAWMLPAFEDEEKTPITLISLSEEKVVLLYSPEEIDVDSDKITLGDGTEVKINGTSVSINGKTYKKYWHLILVDDIDNQYWILTIPERILVDLETSEETSIPGKIYGLVENMHTKGEKEIVYVAHDNNWVIYGLGEDTQEEDEDFTDENDFEPVRYDKTKIETIELSEPFDISNIPFDLEIDEEKLRDVISRIPDRDAKSVFVAYIFKAPNATLYYLFDAATYTIVSLIVNKKGQFAVSNDFIKIEPEKIYEIFSKLNFQRPLEIFSAGEYEGYTIVLQSSDIAIYEDKIDED